MLPLLVRRRQRGFPWVESCREACRLWPPIFITVFLVWIRQRPVDDSLQGRGENLGEAFISHKGALFSAPACDDESLHSILSTEHVGVRCFWIDVFRYLNSQLQSDRGGDGESTAIGGKKLKLTSGLSVVSNQALWRSICICSGR